jgi:hypothetical protein
MPESSVVPLSAIRVTQRVSAIRVTQRDRGRQYRSLGKCITLEANYGRRLMDLGSDRLTFEVHFVINFKHDVRVAVNLVPRDQQRDFTLG